jgi:hypothetical protein
LSLYVLHFQTVGDLVNYPELLWPRPSPAYTMDHLNAHYGHSF